MYSAKLLESPSSQTPACYDRKQHQQSSQLLLHQHREIYINLRIRIVNLKPKPSAIIGNYSNPTKWSFHNALNPRLSFPPFFRYCWQHSEWPQQMKCINEWLDQAQLPCCPLCKANLLEARVPRKRNGPDVVAGDGTATAARTGVGSGRPRTAGVGSGRPHAAGAGTRAVFTSGWGGGDC